MNLLLSIRVCITVHRIKGIPVYNIEYTLLSWLLNEQHHEQRSIQQYWKMKIVPLLVTTQVGMISRVSTYRNWINVLSLHVRVVEMFHIIRNITLVLFKNRNLKSEAKMFCVIRVGRLRFAICSAYVYAIRLKSIEKRSSVIRFSIDINLMAYTYQYM